MFFKYGCIIFSYNSRTDLRNSAVDQCFKKLSLEEFQELNCGDSVWRNERPFEEVYCYTKKEVVFVQKEKNVIKVNFHGGNFSKASKSHGELFILKDSKELQKLIKLDPSIIKL